MGNCLRNEGTIAPNHPFWVDLGVEISTFIGLASNYECQSRRQEGRNSGAGRRASRVADRWPVEVVADPAIHPVVPGVLAKACAGREGSAADPALASLHCVSQRRRASLAGGSAELSARRGVRLNALATGRYAVFPTPSHFGTLRPRVERPLKAVGLRRNIRVLVDKVVSKGNGHNARSSR